MEKEARRTFHTTERDEGRPLGDYIAGRCSEAPVGFLNKLIRKEFVLVEGRPGSLKTRLRAGQRVTLCLPPGATIVAANAEVPFRIVHEDAQLLVVEKPCGVVSEPGIGHKLDTLLNGLIARYGELLDRIGPQHDFGMVHRLDRDTSGLLVVAKRAAVQEELTRQFRTHTVEKRYVALLVGTLARKEGQVNVPLGRVRRAGRAVVTTGETGGAPAVTDFRTIEHFAEATLVEATPQTGRWRQLRVHFREMGNPIAGDPDEGDLNVNAQFEAKYGLRRLFLHAARLRFVHPGTGRAMEFTSPLPAELESVLCKLRGPGA